MSHEDKHQPHDGASKAEVAEAVIVTVELHRHGAPVETIKIECDGQPTHRHLAEKLAAVLALEAEELVEEFTEQDGGPEHRHHHSKIKLECIEIRFETEAASHHFLARTRWKRVHHWSCKKFKIASDVSANLELRDGSPEGPPLNEAKPIGDIKGCRTVWLVKPGPEPNGR
jgi:hypothetical protein